MNLKTLFKKNGTDKGTHHQYYKIYDDLFKPYVNHNIQFCEIGVLNGNSLRSWSEYFTSAEIIGFDYQRFPNVADIKVHMMNQEDKDGMYSIVDELNLKPFIVIDDGGHKPEHHQKTLAPFFKALESGGLYIIEDLQVCKKDNRLNQKYEVTDDNNTVSYLKALLSDNPMKSPYLTSDEESYLKSNIKTIRLELNEKLAIIEKV